MVTPFLSRWPDIQQRRGSFAEGGVEGRLVQQTEEENKKEKFSWCVGGIWEQLLERKGGKRLESGGLAGDLFLAWGSCRESSSFAVGFWESNLWKFARAFTL
ncbi:hypothetical protein SLEP1_g9732 [Rubroshorea leprosula]|uniref:Uncharacterized protein n=1 Tax=Rubroshorea leprosula TaxID=152421 RepID=A0AAV5IH44_9ROSI|nr:hypothetical protein SLEP1_g9732 [Rubroshorea leprosula]